MFIFHCGVRVVVLFGRYESEFTLRYIYLSLFF